MPMVLLDIICGWAEEGHEGKDSVFRAFGSDTYSTFRVISPGDSLIWAMSFVWVRFVI